MEVKPIPKKGVVLIVLGFAITAASLQSRSSSSSPWVGAGPEGGRVHSLAYHPAKPKVVYAVVGEYSVTVYKTLDGGGTWSKVSSIPDTIYDFALNPKNPKIAYALGEMGFYISLTGAEEADAHERGQPCWQRYSLGAGRSGRLGKVFVHPSNSNIIYASGNYDYRSNPWREGIAFFKSVDGGKTWKTHLVSKGSYYGDTMGFAISLSSPNVLYIDGYYGIGPHTAKYGIFKSTNGGEDWRILPWDDRYSAYSIVVHPGDSNRVWVATGLGVERSQDGGLTWQTTATSFDAGDLAVDGSNPDILYAGADFDNSVSKSSDGGVAWVRSSGVYGECLKMLVIDKGPNPGQTVFFGSLGGVFRSTNGGLLWRAAHSGIRESVIPAVAAAPSAPDILYAQARQLGFFKTPNGGKSWERLTELSNCGGYFKIAVHPTNAKDVIVLSGG